MEYDTIVNYMSRLCANNAISNGIKTDFTETHVRLLYRTARVHKSSQTVKHEIKWLPINHIFSSQTPLSLRI